MQVSFRQSISSVADQRALMFPADGSCAACRSARIFAQLALLQSWRQTLAQSCEDDARVS